MNKCCAAKTSPFSLGGHKHICNYSVGSGSGPQKVMGTLSCSLFTRFSSETQRLLEKLCLAQHYPYSVCAVLSQFSGVRLFAILWTVARQSPLSMGFSRPEYRSRLPFPSPGNLPHPGIKLGSPVLQADSSPSEPPGKPSCPLKLGFSGFT